MEAIQKVYNIKIYTIAGVLITPIADPLIMNPPRFTAQLGGGQGELRLRLKLNFNTALINFNNIIKVYEADDAHPTARLIYTGVVGSLRRILDKTGEYIELRAVGVASLFSYFYFKNAGNYAFTLNQDPKQTLKAIADYINTLYPNLISYTDGVSIEAVGSSANISFNYTKALDAIKNTVAVTDYRWSIDGSGVLQFHPKTGGIGQTLHKFAADLHIDNLEIEENTEKIVNNYILNYTGGQKTTSDATSQTTYGLRELAETKTNIQDLATATTAGAAYIADNKDYKSKITITVNNKYDIESIKPGDLIKVTNFDYNINNLQIIKIDYNPNSIKLELDAIDSFVNELYS